jgi:hypothetical protein
LPAELAAFTQDQVVAYDAAWAACDDTLTAGWSGDPTARAALSQCVADHVGVATDDANLAVFVNWVARYQDGGTG